MKIAMGTLTPVHSGKTLRAQMNLHGPQWKSDADDSDGRLSVLGVVAEECKGEGNAIKKKIA